MPSTETIICAAVWVDDGVESGHLPHNLQTGLVFAGWRHHNCIAQIKHAFPEGSVDEEKRRGLDQGFLTSKNRYVNREEAAKLAFYAGQIQVIKSGLCSEDLY